MQNAQCILRVAIHILQLRHQPHLWHVAAKQTRPGALRPACQPRQVQTGAALVPVRFVGQSSDVLQQKTFAFRAFSFQAAPVWLRAARAMACTMQRVRGGRQKACQRSVSLCGEAPTSSVASCELLLLTSSSAAMLKGANEAGAAVQQVAMAVAAGSGWWLMGRVAFAVCSSEEPSSLSGAWLLRDVHQIRAPAGHQISEPARLSVCMLNSAVTCQH
jgi:hypothetical protein